MPKLEILRNVLRDKSMVEKSILKPYNGKMSLSSKILARAIYEKTPLVIKELLLENGEVCIAGGYVRDRLNNTVVGDIDLWIFGSKANFSSVERICTILESKGCVEEYRSKFSTTYSAPFAHTIQVMNRISNDIREVINRFDFYCCKAALYVNNGIPRLEEDIRFRKHALEKNMVPIENLEVPSDVLKHLIKLRRKGYTITVKNLYSILEEHEKIGIEKY